MFDKLLLKVSIAIVSLATTFAGLFGIASKADIPTVSVTQNPAPRETALGAAIPTVVSLFETSLQAKISASDTSMNLVSGTDRNGNALSGYYCFTIDEGSASVEFVCGTASSTAITALTRGIDPVTGVTSVTALKKTHNRGATVKITNYPQDAIISRILNGDDTLPNAIRYTPSVSTSTLAGNTQNLASVAYANGIALQGAPTATGTTPGIIQLASGIQLSSGTAQSGAYTLVPANSFFNSTTQSATTVPVTGSNGKLSQGFFDLSQSWTFTGSLANTAATTTLAATTTKPLILDGISYTFPGTQGAANTALINNGSGSLSWTGISTVYASGVTTKNLTDGSFTGTTTIAHGLGYTPKFVRITAVLYLGTTSQTNSHSTGTYNGSSQVCVYDMSGSTGGSVANQTSGTDTKIVHITEASDDSVKQVGTINIDGTNITIGWTKSMSPTGTAQIMWEAW